MIAVKTLAPETGDRETWILFNGKCEKEILAGTFQSYHCAVDLSSRISVDSGRDLVETLTQLHPSGTDGVSYIDGQYAATNNRHIYDSVGVVSVRKNPRVKLVPCEAELYPKGNSHAWEGYGHKYWETLKGVATSKPGVRLAVRLDKADLMAHGVVPREGDRAHIYESVFVYDRPHKNDRSTLEYNPARALRLIKRWANPAKYKKARKDWFVDWGMDVRAILGAMTSVDPALPFVKWEELWSVVTPSHPRDPGRMDSVRSGYKDLMRHILAIYERRKVLYSPQSWKRVVRATGWKGNYRTALRNLVKNRELHTRALSRYAPKLDTAAFYRWVRKEHRCACSSRCRK